MQFEFRWSLVAVREIPQHLCDAITIGKADAVLAASIFHFGEYTIRETKEAMAAEGIPVRIDC